VNSWLTSWLAALRIARREALRDKARNLLIVAMLMLPVLGVSAFETVLNSTGDLSTQEQLARKTGTTDAWIIRNGTSAVQQNTGLPTLSLPADWRRQVTSGDFDTPQTSDKQQADDSGIRAALPNATLLPETSSGGVFMHGPAGYASPGYTQVDLTKPQLSGAFDLLSGRVPKTANELDLTPRTMKEFGAVIGSTITLPASASANGKPATFTVVGEMDQPDSTNADAVFALPSAAVPTGAAPQGWFVLNPGGVSWSQVQAMNKTGYVVTSRDVALDPPSASQVPYNALRVLPGFGQGGNDAAGAAVLAIAVGIALLEVVLLAGPAFAVSARRRERDYAIIGAAGADASHLRRIVLADGIVLGAVAGVVGAGLGFGAAAAVLPWIGHLGTLPGHVHVNLLHVVGIALLSMVLGLCAAWMPARSVARRDILATLSGRRAAPAARIQARRTATGLVLLAIGFCGSLLDRKLSPSLGVLSIVGGIAVIEIGAIMCTPAVIGAVARLGRFLPLGPRLALRDSARHTGRTTPAVAAMFAAVAGAVAAGGWIDSSLVQGRDAFQPALLSTQVGVPNVAGQKQAAQIVSKLGPVMPVTGSAVVQEVDVPDADSTNQWQFSALSASDPSQCTAGTVTQFGTLAASAPLQACGLGIDGTEMALDPIGGPAVLKELTGIDDANANAALNGGGAVVFTSGIVRNGRATFVLQHAFPGKAKPGTTTEATTYFTVPAVYENPQGIPNPGVVVSPALARKMGVATGGTLSLVVDLSGPATTTQQYGGAQVLQDVGNQDGLTTPGSYSSSLDAVNLAVLAIALLLAIGAAAIATGLALADGRADQQTLTAVGGSPWTRRWLAGSTALVITGLGIVIGVPIGFLITDGLVEVSDLGRMGPDLGTPKLFTVPWLNLGFLVIAVPLLTALGAMALTRSKSAAVRRLEF
jgi:putative ABC transport system permease protein